MKPSTWLHICRRAIGVVCGASLLVIAAMTGGCGFPLYETVPAPPPGPVELAQLWVEPNDLRRRDLFWGIGGPELAPSPSEVFRFVAEKPDLFAFSPGYDAVVDRHGVSWSVKMGPEARPEVLASRIIWAIGYHQPPSSYLQRWRLERDGKVVEQDGGRFRADRRLERNGNWSWHANPFVGTQPFRGLLVLMVVINNWDLTVENTGIYDLDRKWDGADRWYIVRDVGASFSRNRGPLLQGTRGDIEGFEKQGFVRGVENGRVLFDWNGPHADLFENLSPADVRWTCALLSRLSDEQWKAAFRAAGYAPAEAARLEATIKRRIAVGRSL